ncbi:MAG: crcB [Hymenobacter sp.]|jgi:CrcB protein|nr:crcB [Hymenobacter sp.]
MLMNRSVLFIGLGGFLGSVARYLVQQYFLRHAPTGFPLGTFLVNIGGCLLIGLLMGSFERHAATPQMWRLFLTTGFCGGFTTFSTFAFESLTLARGGEALLLLAYTMGSVVLGMLAALLGFWLARFV